MRFSILFDRRQIKADDSESNKVFIHVSIAFTISHDYMDEK